MTNIFNKIKDFLLSYIRLIGKVPICNKCRDRAPVIFGYCFLLCWRCTGVIISFVLLSLLDLEMNYSLLFRAILVIPLIVDGYLSYYTNFYKSNNFNRLLTGILFSIGVYY